MRIRIDYTVNIPWESLEAFREFASADTNAQAAEWLRQDAREYTRDYLESNLPGEITITEAWER